MSNLRIAAQQALEAWQTATYGHPSHHKATLLAMTALRAALAQQDEPLNLRDPAVQKRLATQWGYVPAAQAEPVEQVATLIARRNALLEALKGLVAWADDLRRDDPVEDLRKARAAIKTVEETK